jgi:thiamine biosynthesis lipoprotein
MAGSSVLCILILALPGAEPGKDGNSELKRFEYTQIQMGAPFKIVFYAPSETVANRASKAAYDRIRQLNDVMSDYDPNSELSKLSETAGSGKAVRLSEDLWRVLTKAQEISRQSDGAFDVTVGPFVQLWRRARRQKKMPAEDRLAEARKAVGYEFLRLEPAGTGKASGTQSGTTSSASAPTAKLLRPSMQLDLGGIGVGFAADEALLVLRKLGITRALVDGSGDIVVGDAPPDKDGWRIGIAPLERGASPSRYLILKNQAVSTSGDAFQFIELDGKRYSHIVDPKTGLGLTERSSVTIVAPDCASADALATAVSVLGPRRGLELVEKTPGVAAFIVRAMDDKTETDSSRRWSALKLENTNSGKMAMLIEASELDKRLSDPMLRILDTRSKEDYAKGHIPGAVWVDVASVQKLGRTEGGFHDAKAWGEIVGKLGIDHDWQVVVYGSAPTDTARIWWVLKYLGMENVSIPNGGWEAWKKEERPVETSAPTVVATTFKPKFQSDRLEEIDTLKKSVASGKVKVVDTRSSGEFTGKEVKGKRGGHIPGATHLEWKELLAEDGRFKKPEELRELFRKRGILPDDTAVCY